MNVSGTTQVFGLIGNPVSHSLSPLLQNTLAERLGLDVVYTAFPVPAGQVGEALRGAYALGIRGLNVTAPYKADVIPHLASVDNAARRMEAVNAIVRSEDGFVGYNTDVIGLFLAMENAGMAVGNRDVVLLGAGGAARAAAYMCAQSGAKRVFILNRTASSAEKLAAEVNQTVETNILTGMGVIDYPRLPNDGKFTVIQCTSLGMYPYEGEALIDDAAFYERVEAGFEMIYHPAETLFMKKVQQAGGRTCNGLKMLLFQGIAAFELWHGVKVGPKDIQYVADRLRKAKVD